jgi:hypothetical protein
MCPPVVVIGVKRCSSTFVNGIPGCPSGTQSHKTGVRNISKTVRRSNRKQVVTSLLNAPAQVSPTALLGDFFTGSMVVNSW